MKNTLRAYLWGAILTLITMQCALGATIAQISADGFLEFRWDVTALSFVICTVSGVAALLQRVNAELKLNPDHELPRPWLFCTMHMIGSWAAGLLAFLLGQQMRLDVWACLVMMMTASYKGAQWLERYAESKLPGIPPETEPAEASQ